MSSADAGMAYSGIVRAKNFQSLTPAPWRGLPLLAMSLDGSTPFNQK